MHSWHVRARVIVNKGFAVPNHNYKFFVEGVVPIRFQQDSAGDNHTSIGFAVHTGIGF